MLAQLYPSKIAGSISNEKIKKMKALIHYTPIKYSLKHISNNIGKNSGRFPPDYGTKAGENSRKIELLNLRRRQRLDKHKVSTKVQQPSDDYTDRLLTQDDAVYHLGRSVYQQRNQVQQLKQVRRSEQFVNIISRERQLQRQKLKDRRRIINQQQRINLIKEFERIETECIKQQHQPRKKSLALQRLRSFYKKDEDRQKGEQNESHLSRHISDASSMKLTSFKQIQSLREYIKKSNEAKKANQRYSEEVTGPQSSFRFNKVRKFSLKSGKNC